jgi:hypothetical protein
VGVIEEENTKTIANFYYVWSNYQLRNGETITYNFYATLLTPFSPTLSLNSNAIRFKSR